MQLVTSFPAAMTSSAVISDSMLLYTTASMQWLTYKQLHSWYADSEERISNPRIVPDEKFSPNPFLCPRYNRLESQWAYSLAVVHSLHAVRSIHSSNSVCATDSLDSISILARETSETGVYYGAIFTYMARNEHC